MMTPFHVLLAATAYMVVLCLVAWRASRKADNGAFFTGNRRTPWYMAAFAMVGAAMSGVTFISVPGSVAADSFSYMQMVLGFTVGQLVVAFVLVPLFYRRNVLSLYEYLEERFGETTHRTGAWLFFVAKMLGAALRVYVVCAVMQLLVFDRYGLPFFVNAAATMTLVWAYTVRGGVKSLISTDALKTTCLVGSVVLTIVFVVRGLGLSAAEAVGAVRESPYSRVFFFDDPASPRYFWKMFWGGVFVLIAMTGLDQDMMQRNLSCPTPRAARKNIIVTALCQAVVILLFLALGALLYIYMERAGLPWPEKSDQVFSLVAVGGGLPVAVGIFFVVGLVASTWSAAGSALTALTTSFTVDLLHGARRCDERGLARMRRTVHAAMAATMALVILLFGYAGNDSVINLVYKVAGYTYGPILGLFAFGMLTRLKVRDGGVWLVALAAPVLSAALQWGAAEYFGYGIGFELVAYNAAFTFVGLLLLTRFHEKK